MKSIINAVTKLTEYIVIALVFVMVVMVFGQVIMRHVTHSTPFYAEELSRYLLIWIGFLGSSLGVKYGSHTAVSLFKDHLPLKAKGVVEKLASLLVFLFLAVFFIASVRYCLQQAEQISSTLKISMFWPTLAAPLGSFLMLVQLVGVWLAKINSSSGQEEIKEVV